MHINVIFNVRALDSVYPSTASSATKGYLEELQAIADKCGKSFQEMLQEELMKISMMKSVSVGEKVIPMTYSEPEEPQYSDGCLKTKEVNAALHSTSTLLLSPDQSELGKSLPVVFPPSPAHQRSKSQSVSDIPTAGVSRFSVNQSPHLTSPSPGLKYQMTTGTSHHSTKESGNETTAMSHTALTMNDINPPVVQRVVVEHVMRASETMSPVHSSVRLRTFSGKIPRPNNELDYDTWRANVDLLLTDPSLSDLHRTRKILDSLFPPATDVIQHIGPQALPSVYLKLLDSIYGSVEDGDELLVKFMATLQDKDERSSTYLNRLQVTLSAVVRRGGVAESERDRYLLKQFCRGCWQNELITDLQLEQKTKEKIIPSFSDLVLLIRTEEDKQAAKDRRMRQHLGLQKQSAPVPKLRTASHDETNESELLKKQINETQAQIAAMQTTPSKTKHPSSESSELNTLKRQLAEIQAQVADMRTAAHGTPNENSEAAEIKILKQQLAKLQAQVNAPPVGSHRTVTSACSQESPKKVEVQMQSSTEKRSNNPPLLLFQMWRGRASRS